MTTIWKEKQVHQNTTWIYNYKVISDECDNESISRLYSLDYTLTPTWNNRVNIYQTESTKDIKPIEQVSTLLSALPRPSRQNRRFYHHPPCYEMTEILRLADDP